MVYLLTAFSISIVSFLFFSIQKKCSRLEKENSVLLYENAILKEEKKRFEEIDEKMQTTFTAISQDVLQKAQGSFFSLAKESFDQHQKSVSLNLKEKETAIDSLLKPLKESLEKVDAKILSFEKNSISTHSSLKEQLKNLALTNTLLQSQTNHLVNALKAPKARGQWGEIQLKRIVEMAGMIEHVDFKTQETFSKENKKIRPDMVVELPNERVIIVDAKAPLNAYLESLETTDEQVKKLKLEEHAKQLRRHIVLLSEKAYAASIKQSSDMTVLFLPAESIFATALDIDATLIEYGLENKILIATPLTLIALLRAIAWGWHEKTQTIHAESIASLGKTLYERLNTLYDHFEKLRRSLENTLDCYNKTTACFENRVLVTARKFQEMGIAQDQEKLEKLSKIDKKATSLK